ncbi:hypothetical protein GS907_24495 [Rhodococcus hoagii]|nr:hypothetical protein [Prescottella equi]
MPTQVIPYDEMRAVLGLPDVLPPDWPFPTRDRLYTGLAHGVPWCIYSSPLGCALNGYARIPDGVAIDVDELDVHGGITYGCGICEGGWIGFDTAHGGDWWDLDELRGRVGMHVTAAGAEYNRFEREMAEECPSLSRQWTVDRLIDECRSLAAQISERSRA